MQLIGLNGFKGSGKDTAYEQIKLSLDHRQVVKRVAFADKLKIMAMLSLGYEGSDEEMIDRANLLKENGVVESRYFPGDLIQSHYLSGRKYLQHFGNHARTVFGDTFWIDQILPKPIRQEVFGELYTRYPGVDYLIVTDVRYPNEAGRIRDLGGTVWEIVRPGVESDGHSSEIPLPRSMVDLTVLNDGPIEQLRARLAEHLTAVTNA